MKDPPVNDVTIIDTDRMLDLGMEFNKHEIWTTDEIKTEIRHFFERKRKKVTFRQLQKMRKVIDV